MTRIVCLVFVLLVAQSAFAVDWRFAGFAKGKLGPDVLFYENDTVEKTPQGTVKVWTLAEPMKGVMHYLNNCKKCQDEGLRKWKAGYVPDLFLKLDKYSELIQADKEYKKGNKKYRAASKYIVGPIYFEIAANLQPFYPANRSHVEIQCSTHKIRLLDLTLWDEKGGVVSHFKRAYLDSRNKGISSGWLGWGFKGSSSGWRDTRPNTPAGDWVQMFCRH